MISEFVSSMWMTCEHCGQKTVWWHEPGQTESKCAYGLCGKISRLDKTEMAAAYLKELEEKIHGLTNALNDERMKRRELERQMHFVKTNNGWRLVYNTFNSIQWAVLPEK